MRSKLVVCAALAGTFVFGALSPAARAADPKGKSAKGKSKTGDGLTDDKTISKQLQWEDSVMGPDDKKAELEKIARAQAINKAAAEKAAREKEKADAQAAKEAAAAPKTSKRGGDVAIPSVPDEAPKKAEPVVEAPPPPPVKHGDDKFIDKLLKDEPGSKKHKSVDDKALNDLLAVDKPTAKPKRKDDVDSLLQSADKAPPMPETHAKKELQEWEKPEIQNTPQPVPVALRPQPKKNDGVIRVVQGAATPARAMAPAPTHTPPVAARVPASNRRAASSSDDWSDPFTPAPKKTVAARDTRHGSDFDDDFASSSRRRPAPAAVTKPASRSNSDDDDWGAPKPKVAPAASRPAPAAKPANKKWKDPFTEDVRPASNGKKVAHATVAARTAKVAAPAARPAHTPVVAHAAAPAAPAPSRWQAAGHGVKVASADTGSSAGGWGVLKKHTR